MSLAHSMNARKCVHAQKPYPSQAFAHESSKVEGRGKETGQETDEKYREICLVVKKTIRYFVILLFFI